MEGRRVKTGEQLVGGAVPQLGKGFDTFRILAQIPDELGMTYAVMLNQHGVLGMDVFDAAPR